MESNTSNNANFVAKLIKLVKHNLTWTILSTILAATAIILPILNTKQPVLSCQISEQRIDDGQVYHIYYCIPQEYYDHDINSAMLFSFINLGDVNVENFTATFETKSIYDIKTKYQLKDGKLGSYESKEIRSQRFSDEVCQEDAANKAQIRIDTYGTVEMLHCSYADLPAGFKLYIQPQFNTDKEVLKKLTALSDSLKNTPMGAISHKLYDKVTLKIDFAAKDIKRQSIKYLPIYVFEDVEIDYFVHYYEETGMFDFSQMVEPEFNQDYINAIVVYPYLDILDGVVRPSLTDATYVYLKASNPLKCNKRKIEITDLNKGTTEIVTIKDTKERAKKIKDMYEHMVNGFKTAKLQQR